jgi:two-component system LytT family response regulator
MTLRVLVVDDEPPARQRVADLLARRPGVEVALAADGRDAIEAILTDRPQLVFLDIQMPELSGLDVVRTLGAERMPPVVFVTAFDRYAVRAFEVSAIDYLLKPFDDARFEQALARAEDVIRLRTTDELRARLVHLLASTPSLAADALTPRAAAAAAGTTPAFLERIAIRDRREIRIIAVAEIDYITASGPYAEIHVGDASWLHRERMQSLEELLDPAAFCRVHRSAIVSLAQVAALEPRATGDSVLRLRTGAALPVSRHRLGELRARLGIS